MSNIQKKGVFFLGCIIFLIALPKFAIAGKIDSLKHLLTQEKGDSLRHKLLLKLGKASIEISLDSSLHYLEIAEAEAKNTNNMARYVDALFVRAMSYETAGRYDLAFQTNHEAMIEALELNDSTSLASAYNNMGVDKYLMDDYPSAIDYCRKALAIIEIQDPEDLGDYYSNFSAFFMLNEEIDSSIFYSNVAISEYNKRKKYENVPNVYVTIGVLYFKKKTEEGYNESLVSFKKANKLYLGYNDEYGQATSLLNMGYAHLELGKTKKAIKEGREALVVFRKLNDRQSVLDVYSFLADAYFRDSEYLKAYAAKDSELVILQELKSAESEKTILELETKYESDKKEKENQLLKNEAELQRVELKRKSLVQWAMIGGILLLIIITALIFVQFRLKKKANFKLSSKNEEIEKQNGEISAQRNLLQDQNHVLAEQKKEITESITYAERIQRALLNRKQKKQNLFPPFFIYFQPKDIVSGDYYWTTEKNGYIYITAADCTGHGVPGGFMSMLGISFLNEIIKMHEVINPSEILNLLRTRIIADLGQGEGKESKDGMDMALIRYHPEKGELLYAGANNPMYVITNDSEKKEIADRIVELEGVDNQLVEIKANKQPVGYRSEKDASFSDVSLKMKKGEVIYLASDGYADQFGGSKGKKLGYKKFKHILLENHKMDLEDQRNHLNEYFDNWIAQSTKNDVQIDDVCVIGIQF